MTFLPENYEGFWTLGAKIVRQGVCLHSGDYSEVTLLPSFKEGFYLSFGDNPDNVIKLSSTQIRNSPLCTTLDFGFTKLATVEHLFAALIGCGLTHVHIQVSGQEIPLLDGSALSWVEGIKAVGLIPVTKSSKDKRLTLNKPLLIHRDSSIIVATPSESLSLVGVIDFPYEAIGRQCFSIKLTPKTFAQEIAPARTFGFVDQIEKLKEAGLIKGGSLNNALVCNGTSWLNPPLRFDNEPVRHKILDLIGDLALVGLPKAQILVYRGSHALHADLASSLLKEFS